MRRRGTRRCAAVPAAEKDPQRSRRLELQRMAPGKIELGELLGLLPARMPGQRGQSPDLLDQIPDDVEAIRPIHIECGEHRKVVHPGHRGLHGLPRFAQGDGQIHGEVPDFVAEPDRLDVCLPADGRVNVVIGFVMLNSQASGQTSSMVRADADEHGDLRSARLIPPGPTLSPTRPGRRRAGGHRESTAMDRNPPGGDADDGRSRLLRAPPLWSVVTATVARTPMASANLWASASIFGSGPGSMSWSTRRMPRQGGGAEKVRHQLGAH